MFRVYVLFLIFSFSISAEDKYDKKGEGWKAWNHLSEVILDFKEKESIDLCSGRMKQGFFKFGMQNIVNEVKQMKPEFIREFKNKKKDTLYLIVDVQGRITALIFKMHNGIWLFDDQTPGDFKSPRQADSWNELNQIQISLRQIASHAAVYFSDSFNDTIIPPPEKMNLSPQALKYLNPDTQQEEMFLVVSGVKYEASAKLLLAVTESAIFGNYYAVFEDGHTEIITKEFLDRNKHVLGTTRSDIKNYNPKQLATFSYLLNELGHDSYKERKKAKAEFLKLGPQVIGFLKTHENHKELEIRLTVKEILLQLQKADIKKRPGL